MVHGLQTIRKLNDEAVKAARREKKQKRVNPSDSIAPKHRGNPADAKVLLNRPWTKKELEESGAPDSVRDYEKSNAKPFKGRTGQTEAPRS
jgi:hypothetical protein